MKMAGFVDLSYTTNDQSEPLNSIYSVVTWFAFHIPRPTAPLLRRLAILFGSNVFQVDPYY